MRVLVRVDWNVPLEDGLKPETSLKIERTLETVKWLQSKKAVVIILTHLGRPKGVESKYSTKILLPLLKRTYGLALTHHAERVSVAKERTKLIADLQESTPGSLHLLENVRFEAGEEENAVALAKAYAELGSAFVNDAFASCHRAHASVVGVARKLPAYAGKSLLLEDQMLQKLLQTKQTPKLAVVGGLKLSTKIPLLKALLKRFDHVLVGGAMATTIQAARGVSVGASYVESECFSEAKRFSEHPALVLPEDVRVVTSQSFKDVRTVSWNKIEKHDRVMDVGRATLRTWAPLIARANVIVWNGPVGFFEVPACGVGSRFIARAIGARSKGRAFGVAGGGETLAVIAQTKTGSWFDHLSTGGGALLEYLSTNGDLPGLRPLLHK